MTSQGSASELELSSETIAGQLLNSESIIEDKFNNWAPNNKEKAQATAGFQEIILLDPP